eukprot:COSAG01_NODE_249_length_20357_cov_3.458171_17_plen_65_part_00
MFYTLVLSLQTMSHESIELTDRSTVLHSRDIAKGETDQVARLLLVSARSGRGSRAVRSGPHHGG